MLGLIGLFATVCQNSIERTNLQSPPVIPAPTLSEMLQMSLSMPKMQRVKRPFPSIISANRRGESM